MRSRLFLTMGLFTVLYFPASARSDDYARIARLSFIEGHVSFQHPNEVDWTDASINLALQPGDRIYTGTDGRAEIEFDDGSVLRLAEKTDIELVSMSENLMHIRVLLGLCTLTRHGNIPFDVNTPAALFHTLHQGVYRFDVTETGASDGIVRKGSMQASGGNFNRQLGKGELIHVEVEGQASPVVSRYEARDGWDEWTDRRTADAVAYASTKYVPDYVYAGVSDLDRYGTWVDAGTYGYGWVPSYVGAGWNPYWDGRWCYRPYWGWTWVSYEPWGWLPYHYGSWYFSAGFGWCWLPGPSFGFHFWSPGLCRFYNGPGWVSWAPLGPGDYYNVHNYHYNPRHSHYLNNMRLAQHRGPDDLINRHVPGVFRTEPTEQFVNGGRGRGMQAPSVAEASQPWKTGRTVTDRLDIAPTSRSFQPVVSSRPNSGRTEAAASPAAARFAGRAGVPGSTATRVAPSDGPVTSGPRGTERGVPGYEAGTRTPAEANTVSTNSNSSRGRAPQNTADRPIRIWNRVEEPAAGIETSRTVQPGPAASGVANPRSSERRVDGQVETGRGFGGTPRAYEAPRPAVIERGVGGQSGTGSYPGNRPEPPPRNEARPSPAPANPPSYQRYDSRGPSGLEMRDRGRAVQPPVAAPERPPSSSRPAPRSDNDGRGFAPGRWQSSGGSSTAGMPSPSWSSGRSQAVRPSGPGAGQSSSWGRGASQPAMNPGGSSRSAPSGGSTAPSRGREH